MARVSFLNLNLLAGGAERFLLSLLRNWKVTEDAVALILLEDRHAWKDQIPSHTNLSSLSSGVPHGTIARAWWLMTVTIRLRRHFRKHPTDYVITFLWLPTVVARLAMYGLRKQPKLIWSMQSDLVRSFERKKTGKILSRLVKFALRFRVDFIIAPSTGLKRKTIDFLDYPEHCIAVLPNSGSITNNEVENLVLNRQARMNTTPTVVSVGRLYWAKGYDLLIAAIAHARDAGLRVNCEILGEGEERSTLESLIEHYNLQGQVTLSGFTSDPFTKMAQADIFISSSRWETFGLSIVEAMTLGLAVISTKTDGAVDIITHGHDGFLIPLDDAIALSEAIIELIENPAMRSELGHRARERSKAFAPEVVAAAFRSLVLHSNSQN